MNRVLTDEEKAQSIYLTDQRIDEIYLTAAQLFREAKTDAFEWLDMMAIFAAAKARNSTARREIKLLRALADEQAKVKSILKDNQGLRSANHNLRMRLQDLCPGHTASDHDPKICRYCGIHIDELRPSDMGAVYE